jgi:S-phase kinase-associated protein 1
LELADWEKRFCDSLDNLTLFNVICAANFLDMKPLLDVTLLHLAMKLRTLTPDEIRKEFGITQIFSTEEIAKAEKDFEDIILSTVSKK